MSNAAGIVALSVVLSAGAAFGVVKMQEGSASDHQDTGLSAEADVKSDGDNADVMAAIKDINREIKDLKSDIRNTAQRKALKNLAARVEKIEKRPAPSSLGDVAASKGPDKAFSADEAKIRSVIENVKAEENAKREAERAERAAERERERVAERAERRTQFVDRLTKNLDTLATEIGITEADKTRIKDVLSKNYDAFGSLRDEGRAARERGEEFDWRAKMDELNKAARASISETLNEEQTDKVMDTYRSSVWGGGGRNFRRGGNNGNRRRGGNNGGR